MKASVQSYCKHVRQKAVACQNLHVKRYEPTFQKNRKKLNPITVKDNPLMIISLNMRSKLLLMAEYDNGSKVAIFGNYNPAAKFICTNGRLFIAAVNSRGKRMKGRPYSSK